MTPFINIERRQYTLRIQEAGPRVCFEDKRVSEWSRYVDSVWILSQRFTVHWSRLPENYKNIDLGAFSSLMNSTKGVTYLLLVEEEQRPATVYHIVQNIKRFVCWMLSQTIPIMRFSDVTPTMITKYFEQLRNRSKTRVTRRDRNGSQQVRAATIRYHVRALLRIYYYRDRIGDGLKAWEPLFEATMLRDDENYESKTDPIPDDEFQTLLSAAVNFVNQNAVGAIQGLREFVAKEKVIQLNEALSKVGNDDLSRRRLTKVSAHLLTALKPVRTGISKARKNGPLISPYSLAVQAKTNLGESVKCLRENTSLRTVFKMRRERRGDNVNWDCSERNTNVRLLQIACYIIIATSTGMRLNELLALKPGCLVKRRRRGSCLYWVKSTLSKTSPAHAGEPAAWLCGELAANAIEVLEQLHGVLATAKIAKLRSNVSIADSLFRTFIWDAVTLEARPITSHRVLQKALSLFVSKLNLDVGYIHTHRFRRSFARNIVRWTDTPILALQRHFKHCSLLMTDYYIGTDPQLMEMFFQAQMEASRERLRQILSGQCGGPGGLVLQRRLTRMADLGELPKNFRGRKRETSLEALIDEMSSDGVLAYKCGEFTTCLYVPGVAKCGDDGPKEHECHPTTCLNSHILLEDVPFYLKTIAQNKKVYEQLSSAEQAGPFGLFVVKRISNDITAIRPLAESYQQKLSEMQVQYEALSEAEATSSSGVELRNRISEESTVVQEILADDYPPNANRTRRAA